MDEEDKQYIQDVFDGDEAACNEYYQHATSEMVHWDHLDLSYKVYPELEEETKLLIERRLGYLPHQSVTISYEPYLRSLYHSFKIGHLNEDDFYAQADEHIKLIRNKDMEPNLCLVYDPSIYVNYHKTLYPYGEMAKERLIRFLGYEPKLEHSLIAEMWMRKIFAVDNFKWPYSITVIDYKAITLIKYREILLSNGKNDATNSPIMLGYRT